MEMQLGLTNLRYEITVADIGKKVTIFKALCLHFFISTFYKTSLVPAIFLFCLQHSWHLFVVPICPFC